jgi:starch synthase (maltosyl-transferring)
MIARIPVVDVSPVVDLGRRPAKAVVAETFDVSATIFREGHDALGANVILTDPYGKARPMVRMHQVEGVDRWAAWVTPDQEGDWSFTIESWGDPYESWRHTAEIKLAANVDVELVLAEGALVLKRAAAALRRGSTGQRKVLNEAVKALKDKRRPVPARVSQAFGDEVKAVLSQDPLREHVDAEGPFPLRVSRERALVGAWYEFFPRSEGVTIDPETGRLRSGTLRTAAKRLEAIAEMGFNVAYLPPIHPIGEINRKGPNNTLVAGPGDPGSPWAIGSALGGHDAVHPELGDIGDFDAFVARAEELGLEVALDFALQCAPDHPWVTSHPEWFTTLADGSVAYAENPPKKYQDIYPLNFDNDPEGLANEALRLVRFWMDHGVRIFRVDNPHTKPVPFWEWLLAEIRSTDPDVIFLSEAFTRPPMMRTLAEVGFHQSYTYFTWRTQKGEIEAYLRELCEETGHVLRPNFFVNTPDILHAYLQYGGPAAFKIRATLAAMSSPSWGVYSGFELYEHVAVRPGSEEYQDSEKYQLRPRDWDQAAATGHTLAPYLTRLNDIRRRHPALRRLRNLRLHYVEDPEILAFSKSSPPVPAVSGSQNGNSRDTVIVVLNLDPHAARESMIHLDLPALGLSWGDTVPVHDELTGRTWIWGEHEYIRLDPGQEPAHILTVGSQA